MHTIDDYLDAALKARDLPSDRQLSIQLGISNASVSAFRLKKSWPSDDTMVQLAALSGMDVSQALIDLNCWRSKSPEARSAYQHLASRLKAVAVAIMIGIFAAFPAGTKPAQAAIETSASIYYAFLCIKVKSGKLRI